MSNSLVTDASCICSKRTLDEAKEDLSVKTNREGNGQDHEVLWSL